MEDTDSMAIVSTKRGGLVPCPGGNSLTRANEQAVKALSWAQVRQIVRKFEALNQDRGQHRDGPHPGWVISSCTSGRRAASCSIALLNLSIIGLSRSNSPNSSNSSCRRRLIQGASGSDSKRARPFLLHSPLGSFLPEPLVVCTTKLTQVEGSRRLHEIKFTNRALFLSRCKDGTVTRRLLLGRNFGTA